MAVALRLESEKLAETLRNLDEAVAPIVWLIVSQAQQNATGRGSSAIEAEDVSAAIRELAGQSHELPAPGSGVSLRANMSAEAQSMLEERVQRIRKFIITVAQSPEHVRTIRDGIWATDALRRFILAG
jgi:hypothetical protein